MAGRKRRSFALGVTIESCHRGGEELIHEIPSWKGAVAEANAFLNWQMTCSHDPSHAEHAENDSCSRISVAQSWTFFRYRATAKRLGSSLRLHLSTGTLMISEMSNSTLQVRRAT